MPTRGVFCATGQKTDPDTNAKNIMYSINDPPTSFDLVDIALQASNKFFVTLRYSGNDNLLSQWIATGNLGTGVTSPVFYSDNAYNWSATTYTVGQGSIICAEYGTIIGNSSTKGWLCYGYGGNVSQANIGLTTTTASGTFTSSTPGTIDLSQTSNSKLRSDRSTKWLLSYINGDESSDIYYIDTAGSTSGDTSTYTYSNNVKTYINNSITGIAQYAGIEYSSKTSGTPKKWAVCGLIGPTLTPTPGIGYISMTTNADPNTNNWTNKYVTNNTGYLNKQFNSIKTDGNGNWVAVGKYLDLNPTPPPHVSGAIIAYSTDDGENWIEITIDDLDGFNDVTTDGNGNWAAVGSAVVGSPPAVGIIYTSSITDLSAWSAASLATNTITDFYSIDAAATEDVPCFLKGTLIRTPSGEVPIETLKEGDEVLTTTGEVKAIANIQRATVPPTEDTCPYKIPAGDLGATQDLYISPTHGVRTAGGETVEAQFLGYAQEKMTTPVEYYNISIGRLRSELIYANGVAVESMGEDGKNVVADVSTYSQERIFTEDARSSLIDNLNKKMKISYDKLVSYPDSYLQELLSR